MKNILYVTTAIPYVNSKPHVGNAMDYLQADIWSRYQQLLGKKVRFQIGTDEHGNKIAEKAAEAGLDPKAYTDQTHVNFKALADKLNVEYTDFVRTTDGHHVGAVQYIWKKLEPFIYKSDYEGWYCKGCESFVSDNEATANNGSCPDHQAPYEHVKETNYFFKASEFSERIREAIETDKMRIVPEFRKKEILNLLEKGLEDVSVSRPKSSVSWGISVPDDPDQVMYVWIDALSNYLTVIGYPDQPEWAEAWPADLQIIGKDILRFHAGIWPAMLLALDLPLPKTLLVHGHVHVEGAKMSKTVGNVVDPVEVIDGYGVDAFRYFFARHIPTQDDGDFTWQRFEMAYNTELANDLGNLVQRVGAMVNKYQDGVVTDIDVTRHDEQVFVQAMEDLLFNEALDEVWSAVRSVNRYVDTVKPWEIAKKRESDPEAKNHLSEVLSYAVSSILQVSHLLESFMPETAAKINAIFADGVVNLPAEPLFPKIYIHTQENKNRTTPRESTDSSETKTNAD